MTGSAALKTLALSLSLIGWMGCANAIDDAGKPDTVVALQDSNESDAPAPSDSASEPSMGADSSSAAPVYFNESNYVDSAPNSASTYRFELLADSRVKIHLATAIDTGDQQVGFTLYRLLDSGDGVVVGHVVDDDGTADAELYSEFGGTYVLEVTGGTSASSLVLDLSCLSGQCSAARQPGQTCGSASPYLCADGLVCRFADGSCKAGDSPAKCQIPPSSCSSAHAPVCGCDGKTWGNECFARQAGVSILKTGECDGSK